MKQALDKDLVSLIKNLGLSEKAAEVYLASLELGEATVQQLAKKANLKRTTIYYTLEELKDAGAILETKRNKKSFYLPETPKNVLKRVKEKIWDTESSLDILEGKMHSIYKRPRIYFLYGPSGFKKIWDMIFATPDKEFRIITEGSNFLDFVREKYILDYIIKTKKKLNIFSRQLIQDSPYARGIVAKDKQENRVSKIFSSRHKIPFTEVICHDFVAFISPRFEDTLFVVENESYAQTRRSLFEILWENIK
jgi:sugar-specific transcriptional regulator TrmB